MGWLLGNLPSVLVGVVALLVHISQFLKSINFRCPDKLLNSKEAQAHGTVDLVAFVPACSVNSVAFFIDLGVTLMGYNFHLKCWVVDTLDVVLNECSHFNCGC